MQRYGGWQARMDETRSAVGHIEDHHREYDRYTLDSLEMANFSSPYPFWESVTLHYVDGELKRAHLSSDPKKEKVWKKLYFDKGVLIYGCVNTDTEKSPSAPNQEYFFEQKALVFALDENGEKRDITDEAVLIQGVDQMNEAKQILGIFATNNLGN